MPLYLRADSIQEEQRKTEARLASGVAHIKKTFKGDERMMMLQTYYRQNNYNPIYTLRSATSLLLQIPFFIAAYQFLSSNKELAGVSFGLINDLNKPDGLITVFGLSINILPFVMTAVNLISSFLYSNNMPKKTKIQLYLTALAFLVLLYNSPSGLLIYWTLNNVYSLIKTVVMKSKNKTLASYIAISITGIIAFLACIAFVPFESNLFTIVVFISIVVQFPFLLYRLNKIKRKKVIKSKFSFAKGRALSFISSKPNNKLFISCTLFLTFFTGAVIPSNVIVSSPFEFSFYNYDFNPVWFVVSATILAAGTFVLWCGIFYRLSTDKVKKIIEFAVIIICFSAAVNYFLFGKHLGDLTNNLTFDGGLKYSFAEIAINSFVAIIVVILMFLLIPFFNKHKKQLTSLVLICSFAFVLLGTINTVNINSQLSASENNRPTKEFAIPLSKTKRNVVVIMLDRAIGGYVPYIFNENPSLNKQFSGFTYYSNTISFGRHTNFASPALFGGYEYTPVELNTRSKIPLAEKQNEAISLMPVVFGENGYHITYVNPTYVNYSWRPDLSYFDKYSYISPFIVEDLFQDDSAKERFINDNFRNFYLHSITRISPIVLQKLLYNSGVSYKNERSQHLIDSHRAVGNRASFLSAYSILENLSSVTEVSDGEGEVLIMTNDATHDIQLLQEPDYAPTQRIDNTEYDKSEGKRFSLNGQTLKMSEGNHYMHYQCNMAALLQIGKWFDYLKKIGVYDNTRIILVADHGYGDEMEQFEELVIENDDSGLGDAESYYPLLMVKDFNKSGDLEYSDSFMTNADVPTIAFKNLINNPVNPFTGNPVNDKEKYAHDQYIIASADYDVDYNNGNQFFPARWYSVHDSIWNRSNWKKIAEKEVLTKDNIK